MPRSLRVILTLVIAVSATWLAERWGESAEDALHYLRYHHVGAGGWYHYLYQLTLPVAAAISICFVQWLLEMTCKQQVIRFAIVAVIILGGWFGA